MSVFSRRRSRIAQFKAPFIVSVAGPAALGVACGGQAGTANSGTENPGQDPDSRSVLAHADADVLPPMLSYGFDQLGASGAANSLAQRWGLMPGADYSQALLDCLERDYVPRFREHDIDARAAWQGASSARA